MKMIRVSEAHVDEVNEIILSSKSHWHSGTHYLEEAHHLLGIDGTWLKENEGWLIEDNEKSAGFLGFHRSETFWYLEHLWIRPDSIGKNLGTQALECLFKKAKRAKVTTVSLLPEPKAEDFYEKAGAKFSGLEVPSLLEGGPIFKEMKFFH